MPTISPQVHPTSLIGDGRPPGRCSPASILPGAAARSGCASRSSAGTARGSLPRTPCCADTGCQTDRRQRSRPPHGGTSPSQRYLGTPRVPSSVSDIRTPQLPLLPLWEKGAGGMRGKRAPECRKSRISPRESILESSVQRGRQAARAPSSRSVAWSVFLWNLCALCVSAVRFYSGINYDTINPCPSSQKRPHAITPSMMAVTTSATVAGRASSTTRVTRPS